MIRTSPVNDAVNRCSARCAGPWSTVPALVLYCDPWHGHAKRSPLKLVIVQPSWVHMAVNTLNTSPAARATRNEPLVDSTRANPPGDASGEAASIVTLTPPPTGVPLTTRRDEPALGEVGLLLHPSRSDASAISGVA